MGIAGEHLTGAEMAAGLTRALGEDVRYDAVSPATYRGLGFPGAADLANMFQFKRDFNELFCGTRDVALTRRLNPSLLTFDSGSPSTRRRYRATSVRPRATGIWIELLPALNNRRISP